MIKKNRPNPVAPLARESGYRWSDLLAMIQDHRRELIVVNIIAGCGTLAAVPVPLLIPVLVDEILLHQPGRAVAITNGLFPQSRHGPVGRGGIRLSGGQRQRPAVARMVLPTPRW